MEKKESTEKFVRYNGSNCIINIYNLVSEKKWKKSFESWISQKKDAWETYGSRGSPIPEWLTEEAYCLTHGVCYRCNSMKSVNGVRMSKNFDIYDVFRNKCIQIKASSVKKDCTSFGPTSVADEIYYLDFSNMDGTFYEYKIDENLLSNIIVCKEKNETFLDQKKIGRRPRLSLKDLAKNNNIQPVYNTFLHL